MIEWIKQAWQKLLEWIRYALFGKKKPPPAFLLPFYIEELRDGHPGMSDEELSQIVWLTAEKDTRFFEPFVLKNGEIYRNDDGFMVLKPMKNQHIQQGQLAHVYRWSFKVNGGNVRESYYKVEGDQKGLINIKDFSKPE